MADHWWGSRNVLYIDVDEQIRRLQNKLHDFSREKENWLQLTAIVPWPAFQSLFKRMRVSVAAYKDRGNKYIGYYGDYKELVYALDALDTLGQNTSSRSKGDAFGRVFLAASKFFAFAPKPLDGYAKPLESIGSVFGTIADMVSGDYKYTNSKFGNYTPQQLRRIMNGETTGDG